MVEQCIPCGIIGGFHPVCHRREHFAAPLRAVESKPFGEGAADQCIGRPDRDQRVVAGQQRQVMPEAAAVDVFQRTSLGKQAVNPDRFGAVGAEHGCRRPAVGEDEDPDAVRREEAERQRIAECTAQRRLGDEVEGRLAVQPQRSPLVAGIQERFAVACRPVCRQ